MATRGSRAELPSGIVLAGGRSRRFGADKLAVEISGEPLLWRPIRALAACCSEVVVALGPDGPAPDLPRDLAVPIVLARDPVAFEGPLVGLGSGLAVAYQRVVVAVAGDQPALRPAILELLARAVTGGVRAAALVDLSGTTRPLPLAVDRLAGLAAVDRLGERGERRLRSVLSDLDALAVPVSDWSPLDPEAGWTLDVDTAGDLPTGA